MISMDLWTNFYHFCVVLNKLFNIIHAFSLCVLCCSKLINFIQAKILLFLFKIRKKRSKNKQGIAYRRQIDQNIIQKSKEMRGKGRGVWVYAP